MRYDMEPPMTAEVRYVPPQKTWWQAMPLLVRAALWFTALCVFLPLVILGGLATLGVVSHFMGWL